MVGGTFRLDQWKASEFREQEFLQVSVSGVQCDMLHVSHHDVLHTNVRLSEQKHRQFEKPMEDFNVIPTDSAHLDSAFSFIVAKT